MPLPCPPLAERLHPGARLLLGFPVELDPEDRARVPLEVARQVAVDWRAPRQVQDHPVDELDGHRPAPHRGWGGRDRISDRLEVADERRDRPRLLHETHRGLDRDGERPLRADDEVSEIEGPCLGEHPLETVAARAAPVRGDRTADRLRIPLDQGRDLPVEPSLERIRPRAPCDLLGRGLPEHGPAPVREDDAEALHVVDRHPVAG